jgi:hypothetical protein
LDCRSPINEIINAKMYVIEMDKEMILNDSWILNKISLVVKFKRVVIQRTYVGT